MSLLDPTTREAAEVVAGVLLTMLGVVGVVLRVKEGHDKARTRREPRTTTGPRPPEA